VFQTVILVILAIFLANLFGAFEIALPSSVQTRFARAGGGIAQSDHRSFSRMVTGLPQPGGGTIWAKILLGLALAATTGGLVWVQSRVWPKPITAHPD